MAAPKAAPRDTRPLATIAEVAAYLQIPVATLYNQRHRRVDIGALAKKIGGHLRWRWADIEAYLDQQQTA
ncbi:hypothetical protein GCM10010174_69720 [Kutzneria viridogrisea]|uniref:DNA-binding transcriptional regulator AlpA n=1 Tax=Kutzneria viridogrisea TaxID=47990 RepID=A0ABR6BAY2_9PSEU|nr:putative DNA-binding transcriptional regulator AlpA [Kutzneria viridogrisea]